MEVDGEGRIMPEGREGLLKEREDPGMKCLALGETGWVCVFDDLCFRVDCRLYENWDDGRCFTILFPVLGI